MSNCRNGHPRTPENTYTRADGRYECRICKREANNARRAIPTNRDKSVASQLRWRQNLKAKVIAGYGSRCACCGETHPAFLTVDHLDNDGGGKNRQSANVLYRWLIANDYPTDRFELVCFNCNSGRHVNGGICPHKEVLP